MFCRYISPDQSLAATYDHSFLKTGHPVRSAILKQVIGRSVVGWVTTSEYLLLYVFGFFFFLLLAIEWKPKKQEELSFSLVSVDNELSRQCCIFCSRHLFTFLDLPVQKFRITTRCKLDFGLESSNMMGYQVLNQETAVQGLDIACRTDGTFDRQRQQIGIAKSLASSFRPTMLPLVPCSGSLGFQRSSYKPLMLLQTLWQSEFYRGYQFDWLQGEEFWQVCVHSICVLEQVTLQSFKQSA